MTAQRIPLSELEQGIPFEQRHIGPDQEARAKMLAQVGYGSLDELTAAAVPDVIKNADALDLPGARTEAEVVRELRSLADRNQVLSSMIGLGYYGTFTPPVILRNVMENPAWYTAYTPYQPEISQGRLEALLNFQTVVADLTGLPTSGASLLDEGTAAAEAMALSRRTGKNKKGLFLVDADALPQTIAVIETRAEPTGVEVVVADLRRGIPAEVAGREINGVLIQYPGASGAVRDIKPVIDQAHELGALVTVAADLLALTLLKSPGELGADIAVGTTQRFGVPMGFGGPHAGYLAVREKFARSLPGRLVGVSVDADGNKAYRLALQTREQHIRREKATSNICTAQVLLAVMAGMYAVYHGPEGLKGIALRTHRYAAVLAAGLRDGGVELVTGAYFDTVTARVPGRAADVVAAARASGVNLRLVDADHVSMACDETTRRADLTVVWAAFGVDGDIEALDAVTEDVLPGGLLRTDDYLTHPVFHQHRSETAMLRYLRRLADRDYALDRGMIPLGSCTMKLNATTEMEPVTWPEFGQLHPFAPAEQAQGYLTLIRELEDRLAEVTGYDKVSLQPNAGSQGELAGLLAVRGYHRANGDEQRTVCLIPSSAHGTNAASAVMAGMKVVVVKTAEDGEIDVEDLRAKIDQYRDELSVLMITYPSTHGVFEEHVAEICAQVHDAGGQVYVDGANLNALVGLAKPGHFGGDVSHLNLHKTFCIPHGGGGPGVGPVAVRSHLAPHLPNHPLQPEAGPETGVGPISAAPWGVGGHPADLVGLRPAHGRRGTEAGHAGGRAERQLRRQAAGAALPRALHRSGRTGGARVHHRSAAADQGDRGERRRRGQAADRLRVPRADDVVPGRRNADDRADRVRGPDRTRSVLRGDDRDSGGDREGRLGEWPADDNPLRNAPHTAGALAGAWEHAYARDEAAFPDGVSVADKYWPPVRRIDQAFGDRNLVCSLPAAGRLRGLSGGDPRRADAGRRGR
ncbi:aminomethyl-transferring glycine dehydrogenase [Streptomyces cinereospinus]